MQPYHEFLHSIDSGLTVRSYGYPAGVKTSLSAIVRAEIQQGARTVATATARAARIAAAVAGLLGGMLAVLCVAVGVLIGKAL